MRRRRKAKQNQQIENLGENLAEHINHNLDLNFGDSENERPEKKHFFSDRKQGNIDNKEIIECEANFFCEVIRRLSTEAQTAHNLHDLDKIVHLAAKLLQASAEKENAIACRIAASNGNKKKISNCICGLANKEKDD